MKKHIAFAAAAVFITGLFTGFAQAGPGRRPGPPRHHHHHHHHHNNVLEGVVIGAGALVLGAAIAQSLSPPPPPPVQVHAVPVPQRPYPATNYYAAAPSGHWEIKKIWVAPVYETRWNPAHYDAYGRWIQGRHEQFLIADGYWKKQRVWVEHMVAY